jgi:spore coat polysaccharide biosynthesis protein SpsF
MRVVAIIQARMGSTRLPGKVLMDISGRSMLAQVVARARKAQLASEVVVATTTAPIDDAIVDECAWLGVSAFRGSEEDVLDRYYRVALEQEADAVVRITSDCPLIDPAVVDDVVRAFLDAKPDYASDTLERTYPRGLDTEVFSLEALCRAWKEANEAYQRAHVTPYFYEQPNLFRLLSVRATADYSAHRWTVDTREDLALVRSIYQKLDPAENTSWLEVLHLVEREPTLQGINWSVQQKTLKEG